MCGRAKAFEQWFRAVISNRDCERTLALKQARAVFLSAECLRSKLEQHFQVPSGSADIETKTDLKHILITL